MAPQKNQQHGAHPPSGNFWSVVDRRLDRFRRRRLRAQASPLSEQMGPITLDDGDALQIPTDDKIAPDERRISLSLSPSFDGVDPKFHLPRSDNEDEYIPTVHKPKRPRG